MLARIEDLNNDPSVHGILVQLPVPKHISEAAVTAAGDPSKDVDGFGAVNIGNPAKRGITPMFTPCAPKGVMVDSVKQPTAPRRGSVWLEIPAPHV